MKIPFMNEKEMFEYAVTCDTLQNCHITVMMAYKFARRNVFDLPQDGYIFCHL